MFEKTEMQLNPRKEDISSLLSLLSLNDSPTKNPAPNHKKPRQSKKKGSKKCQGKLAPIRFTTLIQQLSRYNLVHYFLDHYESIFCAWITLVRKTTLHINMVESDPSVLAAFRVLDDTIAGKQGTYLLSRLAHVRLLQVFDALEAIIASESEPKSRKPGYTYTSKAIDIYQDTQKLQLDAQSLRRRVHERR